MALMLSSASEESFDYFFKMLLIGDSGVGKSSLLLRFTSDTFDNLPPTVGVDFRLKKMTVEGKRVKLAIWDTVYDVTRRETFTDISDVWLKELDLYSTYQDCVKIVVGNKVDKENERVVSKQEGINFARQHKCIYLECSAKARINVEHCFEELVVKILDTPSLLVDSACGRSRTIYTLEQPCDTCSYTYFGHSKPVGK